MDRLRLFDDVMDLARASILRIALSIFFLSLSIHPPTSTVPAGTQFAIYSAQRVKCVATFNLKSGISLGDERSKLERSLRFTRKVVK